MPLLSIIQKINISNIEEGLIYRTSTNKNDFIIINFISFFKIIDFLSN